MSDFAQTISESKVDLTNCDREPIHIPGSIQPHGAMMVLNANLQIIQASQNLCEHLGCDPKSAESLETILHPNDAVDLAEQLSGGTLHLHPIYLRSIRAKNGKLFNAIAHRQGDLRILELEPVQNAPASENPDLYRLVQTALVDLRATRSMNDLCDGIARHVKTLTGFDRVMVYRFDSDWNGTVISESRRNDLEPFLGLHYPAADIPKQARELYKRNWLRFIADRDYTANPVLPALVPGTDKPLDMSFCVLRSVSPIHLEYLRNMGVGASMSISLLRDGELWGLVACHHYSPRIVPYDVRTACELLAQMMSLQIGAREQAEVEADVNKKRDLIEMLLARMDPGDRFAESLVHSSDDLLALVECNGAAVVSGDKVARLGQTPGEPEVLKIVGSIQPLWTDGIYVSDQTGPALGHNSLNSLAAGILAISLGMHSDKMILWFRPEQERTVHWAGDPAKSVIKGDGESRLSPRGSFALWRETVRGKSTQWKDAERVAVIELRRAMLSKLLIYSDELVRHNQVLKRVSDEREQMLESERAARSTAERLNKLKDEFVATLSHELRTPLNAIQGWAQLLQSTKRSPEDMKEGLRIIERNAKAQTQMIEDLLDMSRITSGKLRLDVQAVDMPSIVEMAVATVKIAADAKNITIHKVIDPLTGVSVTGDPHRLQQVCWNLLNNAVKFTPKGGRVHVQLRRAASSIDLSVSDTGIGIPNDFLPHVFDRFRQADASMSRHHGGLGLGLAIVRNLVELHGGTVLAESQGENQGATFTVTLPVRAVRTNQTTDHPKSMDGTLESESLHLAGLKVMVVDDEADTRELVARLLRENNVSVTAAGSADEALSLLFEQRFDLLISDIGMPGKDGYILIRQVRDLEARRNLPKMPAVALTAYARAEDRRRIMLAGFQVHVAKPVETAELLAVVASLAGRV